MKNLCAPRFAERSVAALLLVVLLTQDPAAQVVDFRPYRAVSHVILAARSLKPDESWPGLTYTEGDKRYAVTKWGGSCAVSEGYFLTNKHVIADAELVLIGGWKDTYKLVHAQVLRRDEKNDLALLKIDPPNPHVWVKAFNDTGTLLEGKEVFVWAYLQVPGGFVQFLRRGTVSMNTPLPSGFGDRFVYIEISALFGTSGSPVFTLTEGNAVGIASTLISLQGQKLPAGVVGILPSETIRAFLSQAGVPGYQ